MPSSHVLLCRLTTLLVPLSVAITCYLYLYPLAHQCAFPTPPAHVQRRAQRWLDEDCTRGFNDDLTRYYSRSDAAPFRLLALGDPQLEGDTSLPANVKRRFPGFEKLHEQILQRDVKACIASLTFGARDVVAGIWRQVLAARKQADLWGNDFYLAHIYRTLHRWTDPTHVTVLGDLLGSQWIGDKEFGARTDRFWNRVFRGGEVVPHGVMQNYMDPNSLDPVTEVLGEDASWKRRIINVVGNHDIGYAGDIMKSRIERFERAFGGVNGDIQFRLPALTCNGTTPDPDAGQPALRLVVLNTMNIDGPVRDSDLQWDTFRFINSVIERGEDVGTHTTSTILLTHIPLHKETGICVDAPLFSYFEDIYGGGIKEQNMVSKDLSASAILQALFGKSTDLEHATAGGVGRDGIILTGHDHEGCDVYHYVDTETREWTARRSESDEAAKARSNLKIPGLREVTVRSMMGEFGGYAALVSAWWDHEAGKWEIEVDRCSLGVQHIWWTVHSIDFATIVLLLALPFTRRRQTLLDSKAEVKGETATSEPVVDVGKQNGSLGKKKKKNSTPSREAESSALHKRLNQSLDEKEAAESSRSREVKKSN